MSGLVLAALLVSVSPMPAAPTRIIIREVRSIAGKRGALVWPGFDRAPIEVDVISRRREHLFCRRHAPGFAHPRRDPVTGCVVIERARVRPLDLAASYEIEPGLQVIAIGTPAALQMDRSAWKLTLLHESFHQYQSRLPGYAAAVASVRTAIGAHTADWPLTYTFPYADPGVQQAFGGMTAAASSFLRADSPAAAGDAIRRYVAARHAARTAVGEVAWRYYEFQVGQEGVARWTEILFAEAAGRSDPALAALARDRRAGLANSLRAIDEQGLAMWKRSALYVMGAIEAEMLEGRRPGWRAVYIRAPFGLGEQLELLR